MTLREQVEQFERRLIIRTLRKTRGNVGDAARLLEAQEVTILRRCRAMGIDPKQFNLSYHGQYTSKRREWLREEGLCFNCEKKPSGGEGGTMTMCPECAERRRQMERKRNLARAKAKWADLESKAAQPSLKKRDMLLTLAAMMPKRSVTIDDLKRKAVC